MLKPRSKRTKKSEVLKVARPSVESAVESAVESDDRAAWEALRPVLAALDPASSSALRGNLQLAGITALRVAAYVARPEMRSRFALLAQVKFFDMANLDGIATAARAAIYCSHRYKLTHATRSEARLTPELDGASTALRNRMFALVEHNLNDDPKIAPRIDAIRPGTGYLDRANDLSGLADIYRDRPEVVRLDGKWFRATDEAAARAMSAQIFAVLGVGIPVDGVEWFAEQHRAWVNLNACYSQVARWGRALDADGSPDELFPDLRGASRAAWGSRSREAATLPVVLPTPA